MHTDRDTARIVRSWLEEGRTALPDHIRAAVLDQAPATRRRRSWWPAWRFADMNSYAKLAIATVTVVLVAVVGYSLLPGTDRGGLGNPSVSPTPSPTERPSLAPSPARAAFPPEGPLAIGRHDAILEGVPLSFAVPSAGWTATVWGDIGKGEFKQPDGSMLLFWTSAPDNVYSDPCAHTPLSPEPGATSAAMAAAVAALPGTDLVEGPTRVTIGGHGGQYVAIRIRDDIGCEPSQFYRWYDNSSGGPSGGYRNGSDFDATIRVWIIDVDDKLIWIDGETYKGAAPEVGQELQEIIDSIQFE